MVGRDCEGSFLPGQDSRGAGEALSQGDGRVALVSGGSHGIGAATVGKLAAAGWDISFCYRGDEQSAREVEKAASELGVRVTAFRAEVTDAAEAGKTLRRAEDELGPVTAVVTCAGITRDRPLNLMAADDWRAVIDADLDGAFHLCRAAVFALMKRRSGRIVVVSSVCAAYDHAAQGGGILARPGIAGFVKALASQSGRLGVHVNAVIPGLIAHDMAAIVPEQTRPDLTETIALRRFGDAAAVADLVAFLLSDLAADITGTVLEAHSVIAPLADTDRHPHVRSKGSAGR